jgi:glycosyltransferase involved in cell wall biosynthesis
MLYKSIQREEKFVIQHVDAAVAFSRFMRDSLGLQEDLLKKVVVVPNTCMHPPSSGAAERDLIAVGSLEPRKNQSFLLEVVAEAKRLGYRYSLSLVGSGESRSDLERMAARLQISDQIYFLGRVRNASSLLCSHKLLVHSAVIENMPIALIEALASGTPILAPAVGGIPEILRDGVEGYLWNLADVAGSARLLVRLMNDGELRKQMSVAAKQRYLDDFAPGKVFASIEKLIYGNLF